jgi:hypothetical protein
MSRSPGRSAKKGGSRLDLIQGIGDHTVHKSDYGANIERPTGSGLVECWRSLEEVLPRCEFSIRNPAGNSDRPGFLFR